MPLFSSLTSKFTPKKTSPRKSPSLSNLHLDSAQSAAEFGIDYGKVKVKLGEQEATFENGHWIAESGNSGITQHKINKLKKQNQQLMEENNLLKIKIEILLDMLSETTAEVHLQENEIQELKSVIAKQRKK